MDKSSFNLSSIIGIIISVVFVWVFLFSIWYSNNILNQEKFVSTTNQVLQSEATRSALSNEIITVVKTRMPIIGTISEPLLANLLTSVMSTDLYTNATTRFSQQLQLQLTSANPRELQLDLNPAKSLLGPLFERTESDLLERIPNNIVVLRKNQIPSLYEFGTLITIAGPILFIAALIILGLIWRKITDKRNFTVILSLTFAASGLLVYFLVPALGNYVVAQTDSVNIATILSEVYIAFTSPISQFSFYVLVGGIIVALIAKFVRREIFKLPERTSSSKK
jgi:hypothetical protein